MERNELRLDINTLILFFFLGVAYMATYRAGFVYLCFYALLALGGIYVLRNRCLQISGLSAWFIMFVLFCLLSYMLRCNNKDIEWYRMIGYASILVVFLAMPPEFDVLKKFIVPMAKISSYFFALGIYIEALFPSLYKLIMSVLFVSQYAGTEYAYNTAANNAQRVVDGYYTGFAQDSASSGFLILIGIVIIVLDLYDDAPVKNRKTMQLAYLFVAFILTGKRGHLIFSFVAFIIVYLLSSEKRENVIRLLRIVGIVIAAVVGCVIFYNIWGESSAIGRLIGSFIDYQNEGDVTSLMSYRDVLNTYSWYYIHNHFYSGIGWGNLIYANEKNFGIKINAHNVYLQFWAETGIGGLIYLIIFFAVNLIIIAWALLKAKSTNKKYMPYLQMALFIQIFFVMYCYTGNPMYDPTYYVPYAFMQFLTMSIIRQMKREETCEVDTDD